MPEIRLLELKDQKIIDGYLRRFPAEISELTFTNLFVWRQSRPVFFVETQGALAFLVETEGGETSAKLVFGHILGDVNPLQVVDALDVAIAGFVRIPEETARMLQESGFHVEPDRDNADYVYRVNELGDLEGRRFHKKRNLIKQCLKANACTYEPITVALVPECMAMQKHWCQIRQCGHDPGLCREFVAVNECLAHWENLAVMGGAIRIDGSLKAFALGEMLRPDTAVCHFEKAMPEYRGLGQLINQWFAKYTLKGVAFENREQDLGLPGLRQAKKSYYPDHMVNKYRAWLPGVSPQTIVPVEPHECGKHEKESLD